jgi:hypothetical protein
MTRFINVQWLLKLRIRSGSIREICGRRRAETAIIQPRLGRFSDQFRPIQTKKMGKLRQMPLLPLLRLKFFAGQLQRSAPLFDKPLEGRVTRVPDPAPLALASDSCSFVSIRGLKTFRTPSSGFRSLIHNLNRSADSLSAAVWRGELPRAPCVNAPLTNCLRANTNPYKPITR